MKSVLLTAGLLGLLVPSSIALTANTLDFDWATVTPCASLNYTTCYDDHKCAKLLVPLDWLDPANNSVRVTLAIIARPAVVSERDPRFGGTIIVNPGGPGGSGVQFVLVAGGVIQRAADSDTRKYEILSFDPRGVGFTTPNSDCYRDEFARAVSMVEQRGMGFPDEGARVVKRIMATAHALGHLCEGGDAAEDNNIRGFMSTSSVARDMVEIVDKMDELRREPVGLDEVRQGDGDHDQRTMELRRSVKDGVARIQYWGFSYGTVLGNYFASMFPGRVGRMILEGVEDVYDYYNTTWALNLLDSQKALEHLWDTCYEGGSRCALYRSTDKSPSDIRARVEGFMDALDASPAPFVSQSTVVSITKADVITNLFSGLYQPLRNFPSLADVLSEAMAGNFTQLYGRLGAPKATDTCPLRIPGTYTWFQDAQYAIACGDGESRANLTIPEFMEYLGRLKKDSPDFGGGMSAIVLTCSGWRVRPKYRFSGPWTTPEADSGLVEGRPAAPLLFISSRTDPVTPLANAYAASKAHPGSTVLVQENVGHGSILVPGKCRDDFVKRYFETGELPPEGTLCQPDCRPFQECPQMLSIATASLDNELMAWRRAPLSLI